MYEFHIATSFIVPLNASPPVPRSPIRKLFVVAVIAEVRLDVVVAIKIHSNKGFPLPLIATWRSAGSIGSPRSKRPR